MKISNQSLFKKTINKLTAPWNSIPLIDRWLIGQIIPPMLFAISAFTVISLSVGVMFDLVRKIVECPKPVVIAINGISAGGGVGLALCGDLIIASESAKFKLVFGPQLGIISDVGASWLIPNLLGRARANGMALLGEDIDSNKALNWGLVWEVFPDDELKEKYLLCKSRYLESIGNANYIREDASNKKLITIISEKNMMIQALEEKVKYLELRQETLNNKLDWYKDEVGFYKPELKTLYKIITDRTKPKTVTHTARKLNTLYNGVYEGYVQKD